MRPNIQKETIDMLTVRADEVLTVDAADLSIENRLKAVLATIEEIDDDPDTIRATGNGARWYDK